MNLLESANRFPPCLCRYVARKDHGLSPLSHRELAKISGLSKSTVATLSLKDSWNGVAIDVVVKFSRACGVDLMRPAAMVAYLRDGKKHHLTKLDKQQRKFFLRLLKRG